MMFSEIKKILEDSERDWSKNNMTSNKFKGNMATENTKVQIQNGADEKRWTYINTALQCETRQ